MTRVRGTTQLPGQSDLDERLLGAGRAVVGDDAGARGRGDVATSAGAGAGIDLCLHLVRQDHGPAHAALIARHMVMPPHREGGQAQYVPTRPPGDELDGLLAWASQRLATPLSVADLAAHLGVSPRTLARRFVERLGTSPGAWLLSRRVAEARTLLESTDDTCGNLVVLVRQD
ncbi:Helix-turn-helix domain-containing protein [Goodfellowiella coeruleoviolacea]|uniref:Helix-turn-helix domain-containing protein n=1 Tax=Goodfellowiella coeruleoviolacea TaxID=334858 RepID=A0AAE3GHY0_9PSEU|nr:Helix-turn-helix domain-containing protein [Goodfellowiella coeruleoviolacea]